MIYLFLGGLLLLMVVLVLTVVGNHYYNDKGTITFVIIGVLLFILAFISYELGTFLYSVIGCLCVVGALLGRVSYIKKLFIGILK